MAKPLVDDGLWMVVEPLLPEHKPHPKGGKPPADDRVCLTGILFVLKTGIAWEDFPCEMGCCGMTLLNRLRQWQKAGVWDAMHRLMLDKLRAADGIDFSRVIVDSSSVRAMHGGKKRVRAPWTAEKPAPNTTGGRRDRRAAGDQAHGSQPPRRDTTAAAGGCHSADPGGRSARRSASQRW